MDAKHGDQVFTPRIGKPVEINALWLNALDVAGASLRRWAMTGSNASANPCLQAQAQGSADSGTGACLPFDVIDVDGGGTSDARIRPIKSCRLAALCTLSAAQMRAVVDLLRSRTSDQLRTAQLELEGTGLYRPLLGRRAPTRCAYHMGTVWAWLLGPFARAHYRVYGDARWRSPFWTAGQHLNSACLGTVSEIFDGDAPHSARGSFAQAWSVAEDTAHLDRPRAQELQELRNSHR